MRSRIESLHLTDRASLESLRTQNQYHFMGEDSTTLPICHQCAENLGVQIKATMHGQRKLVRTSDPYIGECFICSLIRPVCEHKHVAVEPQQP
jgi:hypothetical protein